MGRGRESCFHGCFSDFPMGVWETTLGCQRGPGSPGVPRSVSRGPPSPAVCTLAHPSALLCVLGSPTPGDQPMLWWRLGEVPAGLELLSVLWCHCTVTARQLPPWRGDPWGLRPLWPALLTSGRLHQLEGAWVPGTSSPPQQLPLCALPPISAPQLPQGLWTPCRAEPSPEKVGEGGTQLSPWGGLFFCTQNLRLHQDMDGSLEGGGEGQPVSPAGSSPQAMSPSPPQSSHLLPWGSWALCPSFLPTPSF